MKKRKIKDFVALYAPEDEEKLVLIQSGISADKTFLDTFWTAHTHALAMAAVQTGQVISGRCYLSWPLTDNERENGDYSKLFSKGHGKATPSVNPSGMSRKCWRKVCPVRRWRRSGRNTQSPFF